MRENLGMGTDDARLDVGFVMVSVLRGLAENRALNIADLAPLLAFGGPSPLTALAVRDDVTRPLATGLARHASIGVRLAVAGNPMAVAWVWPLLVGDADLRVRVALAAGRSNEFRPVNDLDLPVEAQLRLAVDPAPEVRQSLAWRSRLTTEVGHRLAVDQVGRGAPQPGLAMAGQAGRRAQTAAARRCSAGPPQRPDACDFAGGPCAGVAGRSRNPP
jgi:hypothetical protein